MSTVQTTALSPSTGNGIHSLSPEDALGMTDLAFDTSDPNSSYELRDMVSVAASYFDRGMIDDADEMLQEALAAGYSRPDAVELNRRIRALLGDVIPNPPASNQTATPTDVSQAQHFTIPLPGADTQSQAIQRILREAEADIAAGRLHSAYDVTLQCLAQSPGYFPIYIRLAELRLALGDPDGATQIVETLQDCLEAWGDEAGWLLLALRVALDPGDDVALLKLARAVLAQRGTLRLEPYVPDAIERCIDTQPDVALELATAYGALQPHDPDVTTLYLRALIATGDQEAIVEAVKRDVDAASPADLLFARSAIAYSESHAAWLDWLQRTVERLFERADDIDAMPRAIASVRAFLPPLQHSLATSIARVAYGDFSGALHVLTPWLEPASRQQGHFNELLLATCARAFALRYTSPIESIQAYAEAVGQAVVIDIRPFAEACKLFPHPISAEALMQELVDVARETQQQELAIMHLQRLKERLPEHLEIRSGLADLQIAAGRVSEGVRELRYVAERYEQTGNLERMVEAMRHISAAVPANIEIKAKLIEGYIQRGIPDEATRELRLLGDLYLARNDRRDAAAAYRRGAEIAATTGSVRRAMDLFDRAVGADPDDVSIRHAAVAFFIMNGAVDKATQQLREIVRMALNNDDPDEAVAALHQIIGLAPADAAAYHRLGEVLTSLGEYVQAERVYRRLAALTPDDPVLIAKQSALSALAAEQQ